MTSVWKNVFIDKLDDIVNKYNDTYRSAVWMKSIDVKPNTWIQSSKEINNKNWNILWKRIARNKSKRV